MDGKSISGYKQYRHDNIRKEAGYNQLAEMQMSKMQKGRHV